MKFNREKFFDGFRDRLDSTIEQEQVEGLEFLLGQMETGAFWKDVRHIAYALATTFHETAGSFQPVEEGYYLGSKAKAFQKKLRYFPYFGRGYVQLTWKTNYAKAGKVFGEDLVNNPSRALDADIAYKTMTYGMHQGWFTGKKLSDYINATECDYKEARRIINRMDKAGLIEGYAKSFEKILKLSADRTSIGENLAKEQGGLAPSPNNLADSGTPGQPDPPPAGTIPDSLTAAQTSVIEVEAVTAAPTEPPTADEGTLTKIGNKANAVYTAVSGFGAGVIAWLSGASTEIIIGATAVTISLGGLYMFLNYRRGEKKAEREQSERIEREKIAAEERQKREDRAHEVQMATLKSAMHKDLNTVRIIPAPPATELPNSETEGQ